MKPIIVEIQGSHAQHDKGRWRERSLWHRIHPLALAASMLVLGWAVPVGAAGQETSSGAVPGHHMMAMAAPAAASSRQAGAEPARPRMASHGMLLFGSGGQLYASHIPMFRHPHDMQVLLVVTLAHPKLPKGRDFSDGMYTLLPEVFNLDDLVAGRLKHFQATIFQGNFEGDGEELFQDATVQVEAVVYAQPLLTDAQTQPEPRYLVLNEGCGVYLVHELSGAPDFDQVVKVSLERPVPRNGAGLATLRLPGRQNVAGKQLHAGEKITALREDGTAVSLSVERELSFLVGPGFGPAEP